MQKANGSVDGRGRTTAPQGVRFHFPDVLALLVLATGIAFLLFPSFSATAQRLSASSDSVMELSFGECSVDVVEWRGERTSAPEGGVAGLWEGGSSVLDGTYSYVVGHNPGPFGGVLALKHGDVLSARDDSGEEACYCVSDMFDVPAGTTFPEVSPRFEGIGECLVLQACHVPDANTYRIVVAALVSKGDDESRGAPR